MTQSNALYTHSIAAAFVAALAMLFGLAHAAPAQAQSEQYGIEFEIRHPGNTKMMWAGDKGSVEQSPANVVYGFNSSREHPFRGVGKGGVIDATKVVATGERIQGFADAPLSVRKPAWTDKSLERNILEVMETGYPIDVLGLQSNYGLTDAQFYEVTQRALWHYTDSDILYEYPHNYSPQMRKTYSILVEGYGADSPRAQVPDNLALEMYAIKDGEYQNLLTATRVDKVTGNRLADFVPEADQVAGPPEFDEQAESAATDRCDMNSTVANPVAWMIPLGTFIASGGVPAAAVAEQFDTVSERFDDVIAQNFPHWGREGSLADQPESAQKLRESLLKVNKRLSGVDPAAGPASVGAELVAIGIGGTQITTDVCGERK
ncbi:thioester-forming surface-anchored protein [Corynebacterium breve]|uniref:Thioester-forming surface-anchored protein n=1 Tax=Corynebacterium breve TaxID=3049799 RepID=A0ABY8VGK2_9CORY|nr:thioester-forming surface-anchored protein [Corynebacterium breve]WIM67900.1 thioester-forming surface-anchored protein [Corynebacterium breve]